MSQLKDNYDLLSEIDEINEKFTNCDNKDEFKIGFLNYTSSSKIFNNEFNDSDENEDFNFLGNKRISINEDNNIFKEICSPKKKFKYENNKFEYRNEGK